MESVGVAVTPLLEGDGDKRARKILEETTIRTTSGRFQSGLLWKYDCVEFNNSRPMAEKRLQCLERRLQANPELYVKVKQLLNDYQNKGYAHKATAEELHNADPKRIWYLPLGVVVNVRKPGKIRLIWDAAATVGGQSFNSMLLTGPDLLTSLPAVLCRFRQRQVAVSADIQEMFHQVEIRPEDRHAQRFLWRDDTNKLPEDFIMDVATFGSTCSPCTAQFVKNKNAAEYADRYPQASVAIIHNTYVDDVLFSMDTVKEATEVAEEVKYVNSKAGFNTRNWLSSSDDVLEQIGDKCARQVKSFKADKLENYERVLGMVWIPDEDIFVFDGVFKQEVEQILKCNVIPTKRELLRVVMSVFDPLGFVAVIVIHGKILIQNVWRSGAAWDQPIPDDLLDQWNRWSKLLKQLHQVRIPRCYFPGYNLKSYDSLELHIFVDASEEAYACVAYFRIVDQENVRCSLVTARTKVAPLKPLSIPKLELQAAVIGARLAKATVENHTLKITRRILWSDSSTVLSWLRSDVRKYRQFVSHRVSEILDITTVDEWRWVPTRFNVADDATKWGKGPQIDGNSRWFHAPDFLYQPPDVWPHQELPSVSTLEEIRPVHVHRGTSKCQLVEFGRFSKWERLLRTVAYVHKFIDILLHRVNDPSSARKVGLSQNELVQAEITIWKQIQFEEYASEIAAMSSNQQLTATRRKQLDRNSKLRQLSPCLDEEGVIRMESRMAGALHFKNDFRYPVILPKDHYGTVLLIDWYHRQYQHHSHETVVNEIKQRYHVSRLREALKRVRKLCMWCKVYMANPRIPRMGSLPIARITPNVRAFTYTGIDYFGPLLIKQGRSDVKRWVALFTCLTVRAIHLESVASLSTESCKMAIRRFVARRGAPREIYSDNGTNFLGASRELDQQRRNINQHLAGTFTNTVTQWRFNPPSAPHMGGVWERMVRSVKCALASLSTVRKPNEETFLTLLAETESMVNSRPLTYLPIDSENQPALTPNCFLMLSTSGVNQPATYMVDGRSASTTSWSLLQCLLDQFWLRWVKEYLPVITKRAKWFIDCKPVESGDLVMIVEDQQRNGWIRGRVLQVISGRDGRVRSALVKTATSVLQRPVVKLAVLEIYGKAQENFEQYGSGMFRTAAAKQMVTLTFRISHNIFCRVTIAIGVGTSLLYEGKTVSDRTIDRTLE